MKLLINVSLCLFLLYSCNSGPTVDQVISDNLLVADAQYNKALKANTDKTKIPRTHNDDGSLRSVGAYDWTSGFFAGDMWLMYELTGEEKWKKEAIHYTELLDTIQYWTGNHDVGFMINCSYGNGLLSSGNKKYEQVLVNAAQSLSARFDEKIGCLESWNYRKAWDGKTEWFFPVIIDNMMNLELLFKASELSGNDKYKQIAITHAKTTMKNHYRPDYSCYHVVDYNEETGAVKDQATCQGFTDASSWARGQAWGLYGYTLCYRFTKDPIFLDFAQNIAKYMMNFKTLPEDLIPLWDYHVNVKGFTPEWDYDASKFESIPRDVSAATITASALIELSEYVTDGKKYADFAWQTLQNVSTDKYRASIDEQNYFILKESVGSIPHEAELSVPLNYADYYFLEALLRTKTNKYLICQ